ncbi:MAG: hypothetical protein Q4B34_01470 [Candidatus Saccharibacteria bacterium]|nr:hypothetical protein [Candidatus Saccharibacteria bacterium]
MKRKVKEEAIINMVLRDDHGFLSRFSSHETPVISSETASFLENSAERFLPGKRLRLRIYSDAIEDDEKETYAMAIKDYYTDKIFAAKWELLRYTLLALLLLMVGVTILVISLSIKEMLWPTLLDVIACVFIWEAVSIVAFRKQDLRIKKFRYRSFVKMKIEFVPNEKIALIEEKENE